MVRKELAGQRRRADLADLRGRVYSEHVPGNIMGYVFERSSARPACAPTSCGDRRCPSGDAGRLRQRHHRRGLPRGAVPDAGRGARRGPAAGGTRAKLAPELPESPAALRAQPSPNSGPMPRAASGRLPARRARLLRRLLRRRPGRASSSSSCSRASRRCATGRCSSGWRRPGWTRTAAVNVASLQAIQRWYVDRGELTAGSRLRPRGRRQLRRECSRAPGPLSVSVSKQYSALRAVQLPDEAASLYVLDEAHVEVRRRAGRRRPAYRSRPAPRSDSGAPPRDPDRARDSGWRP